VRCIQQNPVAIDAGVFHQDVVAFGHQQTLVAHEWAYVLFRSASPNEKEKYQGASPLGSPEGAKPLEPQPLKTLPLDIHLVEIPNTDVPLTDLVESYLCNGQIITDRDHRRVFLAPSRCQHIPTVQRWLSQNIARFADDLRYIPVEESLKNGGGPACLRLRMPLTETEWQQLHPTIKLTPEKIQKLEQVVATLYPDIFHPTDILAEACLAQCLRVTKEIGVVLD
jgi:succinylarginine dihydrolase